MRRVTSEEIRSLNRWERVFKLGERLNEIESRVLNITDGTVEPGKAVVPDAQRKVDYLDVTALKLAGVPLSGLLDGIKFHNNTGGGLAKSTLLYPSGWSTANECVRAVKADADAIASTATHVLTETVTTNDVGYMYPVALVTGIDTSAAAAGDPLYLSATGGQFAAAAPSGAAQVAQVVGVCVVSHATAGSALFVPGLQLLKAVPISVIQTLVATAAEIDALRGGGDIARAVGGHGHLLAAGASDLTGTVTNHNALTGGGDIARAAGGHGHLLAAGASDLTAVVAEVNAVCDEQAIAAAADIAAQRLVGRDLEEADPNDATVIGVAPLAIGIGTQGAVAARGRHGVIADAPLADGDHVKAGVGGRATKYNNEQHTLQTLITGEGLAFTQPIAPTVLEVVQAVHVEADKGRGIVIVGNTAAGPVAETLTLDATDTSVASAPSVAVFTEVAGAYTEDGVPLGAQDVTVQAALGGAAVVVVAGATSETGADIPAQSTEAYCNRVTVTGPDADVTFVTLVAVGGTDVAVVERLQFDGGAGVSKVTSAATLREVSRICLGEFTDAAAGSARTDEVPDTEGRHLGRVVVAPPTGRGSLAVVDLFPHPQQPLDGRAVRDVASADVVPGVPVVYTRDIADAATANYDVAVTRAIRVVDVVVVKQDGAGGGANLVQVLNGANAITNDMSINVADDTVVRPATIDDARADIAAGGTLRIVVTKVGGSAACRVTVWAIPVA